MNSKCSERQGDACTVGTMVRLGARGWTSRTSTLATTDSDATCSVHFKVNWSVLAPLLHVQPVGRPLHAIKSGSSDHELRQLVTPWWAVPQCVWHWWHWRQLHSGGTHAACGRLPSMPCAKLWTRACMSHQDTVAQASIASLGPVNTAAVQSFCRARTSCGTRCIDL